MGIAGRYASTGEHKKYDNYIHLQITKVNLKGCSAWLGGDNCVFGVASALAFPGLCRAFALVPVVSCRLWFSIPSNARTFGCGGIRKGGCLQTGGCCQEAIPEHGCSRSHWLGDGELMLCRCELATSGIR